MGHGMGLGWWGWVNLGVHLSGTLATFDRGTREFKTVLKFCRRMTMSILKHGNKKTKNHNFSIPEWFFDKEITWFWMILLEGISWIPCLRIKYFFKSVASPCCPCGFVWTWGWGIHMNGHFNRKVIVIPMWDWEWLMFKQNHVWQKDSDNHCGASTCCDSGTLSSGVGTCSDLRASACTPEIGWRDLLVKREVSCPGMIVKDWNELLLFFAVFY